MSHFLRKCVLEKEIYVVDLEPFRNLQWLLSNATNNINQIAKATNTTGVIYKNEIESKKQYLENDLKSNGELRCFLIAEYEGCIVGTIEYGPASDLINSCTHGKYKNLYEIGTVFVRPDYQGQGIGNLLLNAMIQELQCKGIKEFCMDSGYSNAQKIWRKRFGEPEYFLENYWAEGQHHLIWKIKI